MYLWNLLGLISGWSFREKPRTLKVTLVSQSGLDDLTELSQTMKTLGHFSSYTFFLFCMHVCICTTCKACNHGV